MRFAEGRIQPQCFEAFAPGPCQVALLQENGAQIGVVSGDFLACGIQPQGHPQFRRGTRQVALGLKHLGQYLMRGREIRTPPQGGLQRACAASSYRSALIKTLAQNTHNCGRCGNTSAALRHCDAWSPVMQTLTRLPGQATPTSKTAPTSAAAADKGIKRLGIRD